MNHIVIGSLVMVLASSAIAHSTDASTTHGAAIEQVQTVDEFLARWKDERNGKLIGGAFWTAGHYAADDKHVGQVLQPVQQYLEAIGNGDRSALEPGAIKAFKDRLAALLNDEEQSVRALAAVLLGVCGDAAYAKQIATLLKPRPAPRGHPLFERGRAAAALGMVGAREYTPQLANLLRSSNNFDRAGAALGLGALGGREHEAAVTRLLEDPFEDVRESAKEALAMMRERPR